MSLKPWAWASIQVKWCWYYALGLDLWSNQCLVGLGIIFSKNGPKFWTWTFISCYFGFLNHSLSISPRVELELFLFKMTKWSSTRLRHFFFFFFLLNDQVGLKYRTWAFFFNMTRWILNFWIWALNFLRILWLLISLNSCGPETLDLIDFFLQKSDWLRNFSLLGFLFTSMMAFSTFKFMWASSIWLELGFK